VCNPVAIAAIGFGGSILQGIGAAGQRETNAAAADLNAAGIDRDIGAEREATAYTIARTREGLQRTQGSLRAGYSSNGLALSGSAADVIRESAIEGDLDLAAIQWSSNEKIKGMEFQRDTYKWNAGQERAAAPIAFLTPILGGAAKFGSSFG
jgi:hypothetical protein